MFMLRGNDMLFFSHMADWFLLSLLHFQKPANILVMGEGPERGRVKIGKSHVLLRCELYWFIECMLIRSFKVCSEIRCALDMDMTSENAQTNPSLRKTSLDGWVDLDNVVSLAVVVKRSLSVSVKHIGVALNVLGLNRPSSVLRNSILNTSAWWQWLTPASYFCCRVLGFCWNFSFRATLAWATGNTTLF